MVFLEILRRFQKVSWYFVNSRKGRGLNVGFPTINSLIPFPSSLAFGDRFQQPLQIDLSSVRYEGKKPRFLSSDFLRFSPVSSQFLLSLSLQIHNSIFMMNWWLTLLQWIDDHLQLCCNGNFLIGSRKLRFFWDLGDWVWNDAIQEELYLYDCWPTGSNPMIWWA